MNREPDLTKAQLFLDESWIEEANFVTRQWHQPRRFTEPVLKPESPWERWNPTMYGTVLHWHGKFHMWYVTFGWDPRDPSPLPKRMADAGVCYASSEDGIVWEKPQLGLCAFEGSRENNIVLQGAGPGYYIDNISVIDDSKDDEWPLKAFYWSAATHDWKTKDWGIFVVRSKDGIHWEHEPGLVLPQWIDRFNAVDRKIDGEYVVYGRAVDVARTMGRNGRSVWRSASRDLLNWSEPSLVLERDPDDPMYMQYYSLMAFPYESLVLGGLERMHMVPDVLDIELVWSNDRGREWKRAGRRPAFLEPSQPGHGMRSWDDAWVSLPSSAPIKHHGNLWFYYTGRSGAHASPHGNNYGAIGLALLRIDGFASLQAAEAYQGQVVTKSMTWPGGDLLVNADPRRHLTSHPGFCGGEVRVEIRGENNESLPGYSWDDATPITANTRAYVDFRAPVEWANGKTARELAGQRIRLAFSMRDAHLYSFCSSVD